MKPETLKDLLAGGHITLGEVRNIAKSLFDGETTAAGPEGYIITAVALDKLPDHVQQFIVKAILEFRVTNVLDVVNINLVDGEDNVISLAEAQRTDDDDPSGEMSPFETHEKE